MPTVSDIQLTEQEKFLLSIQSFMNENGYLYPRLTHTGRIACIMPLIFSGAIFSGAIITLNPRDYKISYEDRWCYHSIEAAKEALDKWTEGTEPLGWHRHPSTGRRRTDGDPLQEYINH